MKALICAGLLLALSGPAAAHGFGRPYSLPVPFWLYGWAAAATLILSFVLIGWLASRPAPQAAKPERRGWRLPTRLVRLVGLLGLLVLLLAIATALFGNRDPYRNFSMLVFWVGFVLGLTWLTPLLGNVYALLNPWRALAAGIGRLWPDYIAGRWRYPAWLDDWPALLLYLGFIAYELIWAGKPLSLGWLLLAYTALNLVAVWLVGARAWFAHGEFFAVFLRLLGRMAPLGCRDGRLYLRTPLSGLWLSRPASLSTVLFALAMLATTAFDGLSMTRSWVQLFWGDPYGIVTALSGSRPMSAIATLLPWYVAWELLCLLAAPFLYLLAYLLCLVLARWLTGSRRSVRDLALDFGYSLLPIALVYHITHYATLLLADGLKLFSVVSDPFGWGWDLFGTAWQFRAPVLPELGLIWHGQVLLILLGHVLSVYVAHRIALRVFDTRQQALLSQLPMLLLMVAFTIAGLWLLAQPLTAMQMT